MERYDLVTNYRCGSSIEEMEHSDDGEWMRFEDHAAIGRRSRSSRGSSHEMTTRDKDSSSSPSTASLAARLVAFRAGDTVKHQPSGEVWMLACDQSHGDVLPAGWPETLAKATDCELVERATDDERLEMLTNVAKANAGLRSGLAREQLSEVAARLVEPPQEDQGLELFREDVIQAVPYVNRIVVESDGYPMLHSSAALRTLLSNAFIAGRESIRGVEPAATESPLYRHGVYRAGYRAGFEKAQKTLQAGRLVDPPQARFT